MNKEAKFRVKHIIITNEDGSETLIPARDGHALFEEQTSVYRKGGTPISEIEKFKIQKQYNI